MSASRSDWIDTDDINSSYESTNQFKKLKGHFENKVLKKDSFQKDIKAIRDKHKIDIQEDENGWEYLDASALDNANIISDCKVICKNYHLPSEYFSSTIYLYVITGEIKYHFGGMGGQCIIEEGDREYPATIKVGPYINKSDLMNFVENVFDTQISPLQTKYVDKNADVGKYRETNPKIRERDEFIYQNRDLPHREIADKVMDKFGDAPDHGAIGKIVSLETKRRK